MECPKRGCDLGPCVVKRQRSKNAMRSFFLRFKDFPRCQETHIPKGPKTGRKNQDRPPGLISS